MNAASYEVFENVRLGFRDYWLQQTTNDKIESVDAPHSPERTLGLGAGVQFSNRTPLGFASMATRKLPFATGLVDLM